MRVILPKKIRRAVPLDRWNGSTRRQLNGALNVRTSHYRTVKTEAEIDLSLLDAPEIAVLEAIRYGGKYEAVQWFQLRPANSAERVRPPVFTPEDEQIPLHRWLRQYVDQLRLRHGATAIRAESWTRNYDWIEI
jgi:hypothetical protein